MANLKEIRARISSVDSVYQITKAMKMVASSRIKKFEALLEARKPYGENLKGVMRQVTGRLEDFDHPLLHPSESGGVGILLVTSEKGLCGSYNNNTIKTAERFARSLEAEGRKVLYYVLGTKAVKYCERRQYPIRWQKSAWVADDAQGEELYSVLTEDFSQGLFGEFYIVSARSRGRVSYDTVCDRYLPFSEKSRSGGEDGGDEESGREEKDFIIEPSPEKALELLIPLYLKQALILALVESRYVEYSARLTAMTNATDNAEKLKEELRLNFFRARQSAITTEILEVSAAAVQMGK